MKGSLRVGGGGVGQCLDRGQLRQKREGNCHSGRHKALTSSRGWDTACHPLLSTDPVPTAPPDVQEGVSAVLRALPTWAGAGTVALTPLGSPDRELPVSTPGHRPEPRRSPVGYQSPAPLRPTVPWPTAATSLKSTHGL